MLGNQFERLGRLLLVLGRLRQVLGLLLARLGLLCLLHGTVHPGRRLLDQRNAIVGITSPLTLLVVQHILGVGIFDQCFKQIFDLLIQPPVAAAAIRPV